MRVPILAAVKRFSQQRRRRLLAACAAGVLVLAALGIAGWVGHWPATLFGGGSGAGGVNDSASVSRAPEGAVMAVANLASRDLAAVRRSVAAGYQVSAAALAPAGMRVQVQAGTWRQRGENASLRARVMMPGQAPVSELVYLVRQEGRWRVLFTDPS
jgi:hypothetical protein